MYIILINIYRVNLYDKVLRIYNEIIIVNTNKGIELINSIKDDLVYKECKLDEIVDGNPSLVRSSNRVSKRDVFFNEIDVLSIKELVNKYVPKRSIFNRIKGKVKGIIKRFVNK